MAVSWLAEKVVSHLLDAVLGNSKQEMKSIWGVGVEEELKKLERKVKVIQEVIEDAEEKQFHSKAVGSWLRELKNIAYDADDILDDVATEALQLSSLRDQGQTSKRQKVGIFQYISPILQNKRDIAREIREISGRLDVIAKERHDLNLEIRRDGGRRLQIEQERRETSSLVDESDVIGRQVDKDKIIQLLVSSLSDDDKLYSVIPIVGMGGLGKTTLAQFVYNDHRVETHFGLKAWACVSDNFDVLRITNAIIESASGSNCGLSNLDAAQRCLREKLNAEKFLIVLDDVWGENQIHNWDRLRAPFRVGAKGSKIIMTTRDERVARTMAIIPSHDLQGLPDDDCWELFTRRAFAGRISNAHPELEEIGRQIVKKCNGLPLAVKTLGGILSSKRNVSEWESILTSEMWKDDKSDILPALRLSYRYLPTNQKQCFAYSAAFPKDHEFEKDVLVRQWMAAGFIQPKGSTLLEDIGAEIFEDLLLKSFFQYSHQNFEGTSIYVMHDLMHDLAESVSGDECCKKEDGTPRSIPEMARHLSWTDVNEGSMSLEALKKFKRLRTLRLKAPSSIDNQILNDALMELRCLRVLDLSYSKIDKLPDSIGHLKHLRYLDLTGTGIDGLPESVSSLCNLQTLGLSFCYNLKGLPDSIGHLKHLRYLDLSDTGIDGLPESVTSLCNLQTPLLKSCRYLKGLPYSIGHLKHLRYLDLSGTKIDRLPESVTSICNLQTLGLRSCKNLKGLPDSIGHLKHLRNLDLSSTKIDRLPESVTSLCNLQTLGLRSCKNLKGLPDSIGHLKHLRYLDLTLTKIDGLPESISSLCNLQTLGLEFCRSLKGLPKGITNLVNLRHIALVSLGPWDSISVPGIGKLTSLQTLPKFKVCKESGCQIGELKNMRNIKGRLEISGLEDVQNIEQAKEANLKDKKYLNKLSLKWHRDDSSQDGRVNDDGVLEGLQPHANLKNLHIISYGGVSFPSWMSHLSNLTCLTLEDCRNCEHLFPLDCQLPSLCKLILQNCPKLQVLPADLPAVTELLINGCTELSALPRLPSICDLKLHSCGVKMLLSLTTPCLVSLQRLSIGGCYQLECFLEEVSLQDLTSLQHLRIFGCPRLKSLGYGEGGLPTTLKSLQIEHCPNLKSMPTLLENLTSLVELSIATQLRLFSALPMTIQDLQIFSCDNLMSLPKGMQSLSSLKKLVINSCPQLFSLFPDDNNNEYGLPTTLVYLSICGCENLKSLPNGMQNLTSLEFLFIWKCPKLTERCQKNSGQDWPKIQHIPEINVI
ncbi:putative disease resistance protein RGA3 [Tasmannia lanceolata]|uniref:putative disease resistance protein RGA3 n=1 Tax=Tasmannia lanceolata TaxID=3420 RepID=UPI0040636D41